MIYFVSQSRKKFELSGNYAEFSNNTPVTHNLTHLLCPLKAQQNTHCLARPRADLLNSVKMQLVCAHMPEGIGSCMPSCLGRRYLSISCSSSHNRHSAPVHSGGLPVLGGGLNWFVDLKNSTAWIQKSKLPQAMSVLYSSCCTYDHTKSTILYGKISGLVQFQPTEHAKLKIYLFFNISLDHFFKAV